MNTRLFKIEKRVDAVLLGRHTTFPKGCLEVLSWCPEDNGHDDMPKLPNRFAGSASSRSSNCLVREKIQSNRNTLFTCKNLSAGVSAPNRERVSAEEAPTARGIAGATATGLC